MLSPGQMYAAPAGTPLGDLEAFQPIGGIVADGFEPEGDPFGATWGGERALKSVTHTYTFHASEAGHRRFIALVTGIYRLPGDRPLIHNGKKPRR